MGGEMRTGRLGEGAQGAEEGEICRLPEGCIAHVLSLTSPRDSFRSAAVSSTFRSAAESDALWERFLPPDYREIVSRSVSPVDYGSKKELYIRLCGTILIDGGKKSFSLDKSTGKKCFMLSARELEITWGDTPHYWRWSHFPHSRFSEVAELLNVCWLEIHGKIDTGLLSPKTTYVAYIVFKLVDRTHGFNFPSQEASVKVGNHVTTEKVCLQPDARGGQMRQLWRRPRPLVPVPVIQPSEPEESREVPCSRGDGWMELAMGEFFNDDGNYGEVDISLMEVKGGHWKCGLIVQGIEIRPKK